MKLYPVRDCLQAGEILETLTIGGIGNCYCCMFQTSIAMLLEMGEDRQKAYKTLLIWVNKGCAGWIDRLKT